MLEAMTDKARAILDQVMKLPPAERAQIAYEILETVDEHEGGDGLTQEWREEIARRVDRVLAGKGGPDEDWRVVLDRIRRASPGK
jgi:putative addiction module component (TIGR02574 family)